MHRGLWVRTRSSLVDVARSRTSCPRSASDPARLTSIPQSSASERAGDCEWQRPQRVDGGTVGVGKHHALVARLLGTDGHLHFRRHLCGQDLGRGQDRRSLGAITGRFVRGLHRVIRRVIDGRVVRRRHRQRPAAAVQRAHPLAPEQRKVRSGPSRLGLRALRGLTARCPAFTSGLETRGSRRRARGPATAT